MSDGIKDMDPDSMWRKDEHSKQTGSAVSVVSNRIKISGRIAIGIGILVPKSPFQGKNRWKHHHLRGRQDKELQKTKNTIRKGQGRRLETKDSASNA